jgi:hypothetical protein
MNKLMSDLASPGSPLARFGLWIADLKNFRKFQSEILNPKSEIWKVPPEGIKW